jgi:transposase
MQVATLSADPEAIRIVSFISESDSITIFAQTSRAFGECPKCQTSSTSVHSYYVRQLTDLPWHGVAIRLQLNTRKFRCRNELCRRKVFCERLPKVVESYGRKTIRLQELFGILAFVLGGEAGSKTAREMGLQISGDTLLRRIRRTPIPNIKTVKVLGVDDFSFRRGMRFGTILVDLEKRQPIDLLPDRESETLAAWLKQHPEIEIISRDRGSNYIDGSNTGAPQAKQVADRWHLLKNATEVFEKTICRNYSKLRKVLFPKDSEIFFTEEEVADQIKAGAEAKTKLLQQSAEKAGELSPFYLEKLKVFEMVKQLQAKGLTINQIRMQINRHFSMVARCCRAVEFEKIKREKGSRLLKPYLKHLKMRWDEGCQNAKQLYREIKEQGYRGSDVTVRRLTYQWKPSITQNIRFIKTAPLKLPSVRQLVWLLLKSEEKLTDEEKDFKQKVLENSDEVWQGLSLLNKFRTMVREKKADNYEEWQAEVQSKKLTEFENFARGLRRDNEAVKNALSEQWSNGQVEGQVNRLKFIKRAMYGRGNFDLLKARVLHQF